MVDEFGGVLLGAGNKRNTDSRRLAEIFTDSLWLFGGGDTIFHSYLRFADVGLGDWRVRWGLAFWGLERIWPRISRITRIRVEGGFACRGCLWRRVVDIYGSVFGTLRDEGIV
jgi:hypothetical protein